MASYDPLQDWFLEFLRLHGAETEVDGNVIEAVLPPEIFQRTGWGEFERFAFEPDLGGRLVSYHSDILEVVKPLIEERGACVNISIPVEFLRREGFESSLTEEVAFVNGVFRVQGMEESVGSYLIVHFKATAISEEKRETLVGVALNARTGFPVDEVVPIVERRLGEPNGLTPGPEERPNLAVWADRVTALAQQKATAVFGDFRKSLSRRLVRDLQRLTDYFTTIEREIRKKIEQKHLTGEEAEREFAKIEATQRELARKLTDQRARYAMTIRLEPVTVLTVWHTVMHLRLTLLRRKQSREMVWTYNPLSKQIERPGCESCFQSIRQIHLCDERVHLLCSRCAAALPRICPVCTKGGSRGMQSPISDEAAQ